MRRLSFLAAAASALTLAACGNMPRIERSPLPVMPRATAIAQSLDELPRAAQPVTVAVYGFADQTGQFKPGEGQSLSRAVSQGGASILTKALGDAARGGWFTVLERESLRNLLTERQIISEMRERYNGETKVPESVLPPMLYAGVLLEGGIIGYDSDTLTGGAGANFLGIGGDVKYRQDTVSVYLRAVSVKTGQVLVSVQTAKTIASTSVQGGAFRYVGLKELLQAEAGYTRNEPAQVALQQAIEKAVIALVMEGSERRLWSFADQAAAATPLHRYRLERDGFWNADEAKDASTPPRNAAASSARRHTPSELGVSQ